MVSWLLIIFFLFLPFLHSLFTFFSPAFINKKARTMEAVVRALIRKLFSTVFQPKFDRLWPISYPNGSRELVCASRYGPAAAGDGDLVVACAIPGIYCAGRGNIH